MRSCFQIDRMLLIPSKPIRLGRKVQLIVRAHCKAWVASVSAPVDFLSSSLVLTVYPPPSQPHPHPPQKKATFTDPLNRGTPFVHSPWPATFNYTPRDNRLRSLLNANWWGVAKIASKNEKYERAAARKDIFNIFWKIENVLANRIGKMD